MKAISLIILLLLLHNVNCQCTAGSHAPFPGNCSNYYQCDNGKLVERLRPDNFHWNNTAKTCDYTDEAIPISFFFKIFCLNLISVQYSFIVFTMIFIINILSYFVEILRLVQNFF